MKPKLKEKRNFTVARNSKEIAESLGLNSAVDQILFEYKAELSTIAGKAIESSKLSVNEIVSRSGVARSKVSAIKNGALAGISTDLFLKVITAAGGKLNFKVAS
jgi:predicted XRE-type DNA-binding protein